MRKSIFSLLAFGIIAAGMSTDVGAQTTFTSTDTPILAIGTDGPHVPAVSTITVGGVSGTTSDVNVNLAFTTGFRSNLDVSLMSPSGTTVQLILASTSTNHGTTPFSYIFDDSAETAFPDPNPPPAPFSSGFYAPDGTYQLQIGLLSVFNGEDPTGVWTLTYDERFASSTLTSWGLVLTTFVPAEPGRRQSAPTLLVTDVGAILSANTSGLGMGLINQQVVQGAPNAALRDLNNRLFRSRTGMDAAPVAMASTIGGDSSLLRHLAFVQDKNMSYKVALGLADPEERTIQVNVADTLSAQTGTNFSGQSMSGGLPYAMMGVPLMPMAGGVTTVKIVEAAPSGKTVIDDSKAVVEIAPRNQWEVFVAGDFSFYDQDQLTDLMQGFDTDTYAGTFGIEYRIKDWLNLGLAWSYLQSDTNVSGNYGNIDLEGNLISGYATAFWRQYWADILYSYGSFNNDINRNTGLGSRARGDTDSQSHNIRLNFGRNFNVGNNVVTGPIAGLQYANGDIDPYSESGGGTAALNYKGTDFESMVSRLGWQATHFRPTDWGRLVSQVHLAWEHEYMPENGTVGASLQTSPFALVTGSNVSRFGGYSTESDGAHPGTDWLSAGAGLRFELAKGLALLTDYEGVFFRSNSSQHYASAKLSYEWGTIMPSGKGKSSEGSGKAVAYEAYDASSEPVATAASVPEPASVEEAPKKKSAGDFASWLAKKGR